MEGVPTPSGRAPLSSGPLVAPLHLCQHPHTPSSTQKKSPSSSSPNSSSFCCDFRSLSSKLHHKTALGDCCLVCDSSIGPISFCSSALFIANPCCLGDHVLGLACQIYMVSSSSNALYSLQALVGVVAINFVEFGSLLF